MIQTKRLFDNPLIIHHKICSFSNEQETKRDVDIAIGIIEESLAGSGAFNLLLNFSELVDRSNFSLVAHKVWATDFKENSEIKKYIKKVAIFGKDSPQFRAEQTFMEDASHKWFTDFDEALEWLKSP